MAELYRLDFPSGKSYIGITSKTALDRFKAHTDNARIGDTAASSCAIRKYGADNVKCVTLAVATWGSYLFEAEQRAIAVFNTKSPYGYNLTDGGEGAVGYKHPPEMLEHLSRIRIGIPTRPHTEDTKKKMSSASIGKPKSSDHKKSLSIALTGRKLSESHRKNIGKASLGHTLSQENRDKLAEAQRNLAPEIRAKLSAAAKAQHARARAEKESNNVS